MRSFRFTALILLLALCVAPARAQNYPTRPIHIIVPFPAGGPSDVLARLISDKMSVDFQQAVVVENRPGANTVIGAEAAAKATADGYTLLMAIDSTLVMNQYLYKSLPYDPIADFAPISLVAKTVGLLVVNAQSDYKSVKDLVAKAKGAPGKLNYGAGTISTKLQGYLFNDAAGVDTLLVPYNGSSEVAHGILTKSVDFVCDGPSAELPLIQSGDLRALAKLDSRAFPALPDLPTLDAAADLHLGNLTVWLGLMARRPPSSTSCRARPQKSSTMPPSRRALMPWDYICRPARPRNSPTSSRPRRRAGSPWSRKAVCISTSAHK